MKINFAQNNISFCKTLVATGAYLENGESEPCSFYKLDKSEDSKLINEIANSDEWIDSQLMTAYKSNFDCEDWEIDEFYIAENKDGECIAISQLYDPCIDDKKGKGVYILETSPKLCSENKDRKTKYIGETFLTFIAKLAWQKGYAVDIPLAVDTALPFYVDKCFFKKVGESDGEYTPVTLYSDDFFDLIHQNEEHTKTQIKFV